MWNRRVNRLPVPISTFPCMEARAERQISASPAPRGHSFWRKKGRIQGTCTIKNRDRIAANSVVTANLRFGDQGTGAILGKSLVAASAPKAPVRPTAAICPHCGVVEAVNVIEVKGDGSYLGLIAGGLAGGLLGRRVGQGSGTSAAEVVGAMGGELMRAARSKRTSKKPSTMKRSFDCRAVALERFLTRPNPVSVSGWVTKSGW